MQLEGSNVIITGAGSGIGRASAIRFADAGAHVIAVDLDPGAVAETANRVGGSSAVGDVSDPGLWEETVAMAVERGGLDVAHLNAGLYGHTGPIDELPLDVYERTVGANIGGVVLGTRACVPAMRANGGGAIVVTASVAGIVAFEGNPVYTMTKQAVTGFVRAVAPSLVADGISIDAVCPGVVDTPMTVEALGGGDAAELDIPMIEPDRVAAVALDLALTAGTGRCRAVREHGGPIDWTFPTWSDLLRAPSTLGGEGA